MHPCDAHRWSPSCCLVYKMSVVVEKLNPVFRDLRTSLERIEKDVRKRRGRGRLCRLLNTIFSFILALDHWASSCKINASFPPKLKLNSNIRAFSGAVTWKLKM